MNKALRFSIALVVLILPLGCASPALSGNSRPAPDQFELTGNIARPHTWTAADFQAQFQPQLSTGTATLKGREFRYTGLSLLKLITDAGPIVDPAKKNADLSLVVVVQARDGYAAAFSLPELKEEFGNAQAFVILSQDGQPLPPDRGPVELIVPGDKKPSRWVHGIRRIQIMQVVDRW